MNIFLHSLSPLFPLFIIGVVGFVFYCRFLSDNFKRNKAYILLPVLLCVTFIWRFMYNTNTGRYYILLNIPCVLFAAIGTLYIKNICKNYLPRLQRYCIPILVIGFGVVCIAKTLSFSDPKKYLRDIPEVIKRDISKNKYINPLYLDCNSNMIRIDYYSKSSFKSVACYDFRKTGIKAVKSLKGKFMDLQLKNDAIYLSARERKVGDMLKQTEKILGRKLNYEILKHYKQERGLPVNLFVVRSQQNTFGKLGTEDTCAKGFLLNGKLKCSMVKSKHMTNILKKLRKRKIKCFNSDYQWQFPGWFLHPGHGWNAKDSNNYADVRSKHGKKMLYMEGKAISLVNRQRWDADAVANGKIVLCGEPGSMFAVYLYLADKKTDKHIKTFNHKTFTLLDDKMRCFEFHIPAAKGKRYTLAFFLLKGKVFIDMIDIIFEEKAVVNK